MQKVQLTTKDLSLLSDLLTYEQWAAKKSQMYGAQLQDPAMKSMCKKLEQNHNNNFNALFDFLNSQS